MKKILALVMTVVMVACLASVIFADEKSPLLAHYTFNDGLDKGLSIEGAEKDNLVVKDGVATHGGGDAWLKSDVSIKGLSEITVAMKLKNLTNKDGGGQWIYDFTSQESHSNGEHYFGLFWKNGKIIAEVHSGGRPADSGISVELADKADGFTDLVVTFTKDKVLTVYADGKAIGTTTISEDGYDLATTVGDAPVLQFAKHNWGGTNYASGLVFDEIAIYSSALTAEQVPNAFDPSKITSAGTSETPSTSETTNTPSSGATSGNVDGEASQTGVATVALAIAAITSGAYVVSKKRH